VLTVEDRFAGTLLGLAAGDAVGTAVEFRPRRSFEPVTDMVGGGPFRLQAGQWTDDTSMALCLAESLRERAGFDPVDQMDRYVSWFRNGYLSSTGVCFDIGNTTRRALQRYERTGEPLSGPTAPRSAGNGSIMRLAPVVLCYYPDRNRALHFAAESSRTTHGAPEAVNACHLLAGILHSLLAGSSRDEAIRSVEPGDWLGSRLSEVARAGYASKDESEIRGSGYVVESLEAALWCFLNAGDFEEAILSAANLGDDADTTAAVCGQLAGAYWGEPGIPRRWLEQLVMADRLRSEAIALGTAAF